MMSAMNDRLQRLLLAGALGFGSISSPAVETSAARPNILWISCEDTSPWLGFCGESYALTPNLDRLAHQGVYFRNAFATSPVCSPTRFGIITGTYATSMGTHRLRSQFPIPDSLKGFPSYLRQAGYYCANKVKTDYNTSAQGRLVRESWDDCNATAHWRNRKPGQPFFAVFNLTETHQGKVFETAPPPSLEPSERHDPTKAPVPPYYPDTPGARRTMARVHDCITAMDKHAGRILAELEKDGLNDNTIVFFWPDHGQGIPRGKRTLWDTGLKIPLVIYFPEKYRNLAPVAPGQSCDRMVSLVDLGPTILSLAELPIPPAMQGVAFLGKNAAEPRQYVYGARDRVDEALELSRSVRDSRFLYIRNYMPDLSWMQPEWYSDQLRFRVELTRLATSNQLNAAQLTYAGPGKPVEALYDTQEDPWQLESLAANPKHRKTLKRMRNALRDWQRQSRDLGMIPEWEAAQMCTGERPLCKSAKTDQDYPLDHVLDTAGMVGKPGHVQELTQRLSDADPTVRYWAAVGLRAIGREALTARAALRKALDDRCMPVRIEAAGILVAQWQADAALERLAAIIGGHDELATDHAARTLELLGEKAKAALPAMRKAIEQASAIARPSLEAAIRKLSGDEQPTLSPARARTKKNPD